MNYFMVLFYAYFFLHPCCFHILIPSCQQKTPEVELQTNLLFLFLFFKNLILSEWKHCYFIP